MEVAHTDAMLNARGWYRRVVDRWQPGKGGGLGFLECAFAGHGPDPCGSGMQELPLTYRIYGNGNPYSEICFMEMELALLALFLIFILADMRSKLGHLARDIERIAGHIDKSKPKE